MQTEYVIGIQNPQDISNGRHGERFLVDITPGSQGLRRWNALLAYLKRAGVPTDAILFRAAAQIGAGAGLGPTEAVFLKIDEKGNEVARYVTDMTTLLNTEYAYLPGFVDAFRLPAGAFDVAFPGVEMLEQQQLSLGVIGDPLPKEFNRPGWSHSFMEYHRKGPGFKPGVTLPDHVTASGERYKLTRIALGSEPSTAWPGTRSIIEQVWQRQP